LLFSIAPPHIFSQVLVGVSEEAAVSIVIVAVTVNQIHLYGAQNVQDTELGWERRRSVYEDMEFCYTKSGTGRKSDSRMAIVLSWMDTSNLSEYKMSSNRLCTTNKVVLTLTESTL
jgi:hypothetical protein